MFTGSTTRVVPASVRCMRFRMAALAALAAVLALSACVSADGTRPVKPPEDAPASQMGVSSSEFLRAQEAAAAAANTDQRRRAKIRLELAVNYFKERQIRTALEELRAAEAADPNFADVHSMRAIVLSSIGETKDAETSFLRALRLSPTDSDINNSFGWFLCQQGRERESIRFFDAAARNPLYQTPAMPIRNAGICLMRVQDWKAAETYLMRSFEMEPGNVVGVYNLALMYLRARDLERSWFYAERLNKMLPDPSPEALWLAIRVAHARKDDGEKQALATQLRRGFISSPEWAAFQRGAFDE
jgi:type IV pilus assembly protein PilF